MKSARRRRTLQTAAVATSFVLVFAFLSTGLVSGWLTGRKDITCEKVVELAPQFVKGQTDEVTTARIEKHLAHCKRCRIHFGKVYPEYSLPLQAANSWNRPPLELASTRTP